MEPIDHPAARVICDAGPLIHLDELGCLDLLTGFQEVLIPSTVHDEVSRHRPQALSLHIRDALCFRRIDDFVVGEELRQVAHSLALDAGEVAAFALQSTFPGSILLTDDSAARLAAKALGRRAHGTLAILLRSLRRGQKNRDEVLALLDSLPVRSTLYVGSKLLELVRREVASFAS